MSAPAHVTAVASWDGEKERLVLDDPALYQAGLKRMKPGAGERFVVTVMREQEALSAAQRRYYFGRVVNPLVEDTGDHDWHEQFKAMFMPDDGRTSITQLTHDEMRTYTERCEQYARENRPEAFYLMDGAGVGIRR